ncbi:MAG: Asp-tRNA(Asn)/Glu-tRNA(Gln) amidotransferase subunit GatC [Proteobacteria bacterium]|nr:Asp-tRNA(Asn)/Glu-tRNA(Gln) amidotransferase subunit GatC [Desulfobulbaceae bacterium]MBU4154151.1 Asp-tRNA(Asn)/Glu-tRNA(Gln) amidotransferase subunit GatC [Pseudomonadota bacterium]MDP2105060.1 Asp-tRNA(Asn)/Glu-tRNA(Gln) amidotransferase subunit GatC [Desulfobulbaceae bacterium]
MQITAKEIIKVAHLARLELAPNEITPLAEQVGSILTYINKLNELNTEAVKPTFHALALSNAFRDDVVIPSLPQSEALKNGPLQNGEAFVVPKIIG